MGQLRAVIYARVSTVDQNCDRQVGDLEAFATRAGYEVVVNRPVFLGQMVECIHAAAPVPRRS